jgi:hypothetical protein
MFECCTQLAKVRIPCSPLANRSCFLLFPTAVLVPGDQTTGMLSCLRDHICIMRVGGCKLCMKDSSCKGSSMVFGSCQVFGGISFASIMPGLFCVVVGGGRERANSGPTLLALASASGSGSWCLLHNVRVVCGTQVSELSSPLWWVGIVTSHVGMSQLSAVLEELMNI